MIAIATDVQGAAKVRPWVERAGATYTCLVDGRATIAAQFGLNYVPFGILIDERGKIVCGPRPISSQNASHRQMVVDWIASGTVTTPLEHDAVLGDNAFGNAEARLRFEYAAELSRQGNQVAALSQLKRARAHDADNWIIRKQIWALEHPERFYDGAVDFAWQRKQVEIERANALSGN